MGYSLRDLLVRQVSAPVGEDDPFRADYFNKKYFDWSSEDPGNESVKNRIYQQRLGELSWQDLLGQSLQRGVVQSGVPANKGAEDALIKRLEATGWSDEQKKAAVVNAADKHYADHNSLFTEWSTPEGIAAYLGLPYDNNLVTQQTQQYAGMHAKDAAEADANSRTNAIQLGSVLLAPFAAAGISGLGGAAAGSGAAGLEAGALAGAPGYGAALESSLAGVAGAGAGVVDAPWGVNQQGAGMDLGDWQDWGSWLDSGSGNLMPPAVPESPAQLAEWGLKEVSPGVWEMPEIPGAGGGIWETIKNIPSSLLKSSGILKPDGSLDASTLAKLAGSLGAAGLGAYASNQQSNDYKDLADKYLALGTPSRARYEASFSPGFSLADADPGYKDALALTTKETLNRVSPGGNPAGSPNAWNQTLMDVNTRLALPQLNEYRRLNAGSGGLAALNAAAAGFDDRSVRSAGGVYDSAGSAVADIFNPRKSLADILKEARY